MRTLRFIIFNLVFLIALQVPAQDVHFSQYYFSPLTLNPANTGNYDGDYRFFGNYRSQWRELSQAYNTYSAGGDFNIYPANVNCSGGFLFLSDKSGGNLAITKIMPSFAIHHTIAKFRLNLGVQPGIVIKTIDLYKNTFPNQLNWSTGQYDNALPNLENGATQRFSFFDLNAGASVARKFGKIEPELGYAFFHLNQPKESFFQTNNRLGIRQTGTISLKYNVNRFLILQGHSMYGFTSDVSDWVSGLNVELVLMKNQLYKNSIFAGFMWRSGLERNPDAGIATIGFNYEKYTFGFSYDVTLSQLKTSVDSKGAFEIAIIYKAFNTRLIKKEISCERY